MKKRLVCFLIAITMFTGNLPALAASSNYSDVSSTHWAAGYIDKATGYGIINGVGNGMFGLGQYVTRAQFAAMLVRLFNWKITTPETSSFSDNDKSQWYYSDVETAVANGTVSTGSATFRPNDCITREEMALMLVRALGFEPMTTSAAAYGMPFTDVTRNLGYITIAYDFGIITGVTSTTFVPYSNATREQAAAMMVRLYEKYTAKVGWLHAFYAIASNSQASDIPDFNAISFGWSKLEYSESGGVNLNTTASGGNEYCFPSGYSSVTQLAQSSNVPANLDIYMTTNQTVTKSDGTVSNACREILLDPANRTEAVSQIIAQLKSNSFLSGVTIDFEELSGDALKAGLTSFLKELRTEMNKLGKKIFVCVEPVTQDGSYYNAYDYRSIGEYSDKVILMAHDYQATSMPASLMAEGFTTTPLTPISSVYYALKAISDPNTGVEDISKVALAISINSEQWQVQDGKVINSIPYHPDMAAIYKRLINSGTTTNYSKQYQNAYITFNSDSNTQNIVWYEDERSITAKLDLARMFGINSISVWRLGQIPDYDDSANGEIYYNVLGTLINR